VETEDSITIITITEETKTSTDKDIIITTEDHNKEWDNNKDNNSINKDKLCKDKDKTCQCLTNNQPNHNKAS
jgi:hypothetical protein